MANCMKLYDVVRIDHFRGFDEYYSIPYGDKTAQFGHWEKGPGMDLFRALERILKAGCDRRGSWSPYRQCDRDGGRIRIPGNEGIAVCF